MKISSNIQILIVATSALIVGSFAGSLIGIAMTDTATMLTTSERLFGALALSLIFGIVYGRIVYAVSYLLLTR